MRYWLFNSSTDVHIVDSTHNPGGFTLCHKPVNRTQAANIDLEEAIAKSSCTFCCEMARTGTKVAKPRPY